MKPRQQKTKRRERSVSRFIVTPMLGLLLVEILLLLGSITVGGVLSRLRENADAMLAQQVVNRRNYLENYMTADWSELSVLRSEINAAVRAMQQNGELAISAFGPDGSGAGGSALLTKIAPDMISALYAKHLSGIYVILNAQELPEGRAWETAAYSGLCIRDMDPAASQPSHYTDLLLVRAPVSVSRTLKISSGQDWEPRYTFHGGEADRAFFEKPFQAAWSVSGALPAQYCGYWTSRTYRLDESDTECISYSLPLILSNGTVYGVLGVELTVDYFRAQLPFGELRSDGAYILAIQQEDVYTPVLSSGRLAGELPETLDTEMLHDGTLSFSIGGKRVSAAPAGLTLYKNNAPFSSDQWVLLGAEEEETLYSFADSITVLLIVITLITFAFGLAGSLFIAGSLARPIQTLADRVAAAREEGTDVPDLPATGIREIDQFSGAIVELSRSVMESSTRMLRIIDMASVELGGFEYRPGEPMFVTENFFPMLGVESADTGGITRERFDRLMDGLSQKVVARDVKNGARVYRVGDDRYIRVSTRREGEGLVGLAEDVTTATLERMRIEQERDYDPLTDLYNRRAFCRIAQELFAEPERMKVAALVMIDLDNLKGTNDRFGHDMGDQYIRCAGQCLLRAAPDATLVSRQSGDEFFLLFYGYDDRSAVRVKIRELLEAVRAESVLLPDGTRQYLTFSGGVAWYPDDSRELDVLMKYADFAMYQVKHAGKNSVTEFDAELYHQAGESLELKQAFWEILSEDRIAYYFQPIADARTGKIRAYEALMRPDSPVLKRPDQFLKIARKEGRMGEVERITWFKSAEMFQSLLDRDLVEPDAQLFVNSLASQVMSPEQMEMFHERFAALQPRLVVEIVEAEGLDERCTRAKREMPGFSGMFALDDYGSGYNSEKNLLELAPAYTKIDISIIRSIDVSRDRQEIVSNMVAYAHQRDMQVIAEGVETPQELRTVIELGVDLIQGYLLAKPAAIPAKEIPAEARAMIRAAAENSRPPEDRS